ncbi:MAG: NTP transferase domain-containing protein, partial [Gammaproteobacteria bacterium]|nr:NTP transferase domain-containing protein [Gammaproteobacteria bacterium]
MQALILAAGIGNRLGDAVNNRPKCLLQFADKSLLERHLEILSANGIREVTIVTGYLEESIRKSLSETGTGDINVRTIRNDDYLEGSVVSL